MAYNRTGKITVITDDGTTSIEDFDYSLNTKKFSDLDVANGVIFVPIDSQFDITFSKNIFQDSVTFSTDENPIKGTFQLTHVGFSPTNTNKNNQLTLKNEIKPSGISLSTSLNAYTDDIVMLSSESTSSDDNVSLIPKINLSSNTVYFLNISPDGVLDEDEKQISYEIGSGFMTDNSKSMITKSRFIAGYRTNFENSENLTLNFLNLTNSSTVNVTRLVDDTKINEDTGEVEVIVVNGRTQQIAVTTTEEVTNDIDLESYRTEFLEGDAFFIGRESDNIQNFNLNKSLFGTIKTVNNQQITYDLDLSCYRMNVSYTSDGTSTEVTTHNTHHLKDDDLINVYDVVSGDLRANKFFVTVKDDFKFTIPFDISSKKTGTLNYYPMIAKNQSIVNVKEMNGETKVTKKIALNTSSIIFNDQLIEPNTLFETLKYADSAGGRAISPEYGEMLGRIIEFDSNRIKYIQVDTDNQIIDNTFSNNSIIQITLGENKLINFISANTYPTHNVHPFNTSAPSVTDVYPISNSSTTSKIKIAEIVRNDDIARVTTNLKHLLSVGDLLYINGELSTIFTGPVTVSNIINEFEFNFIIEKTISENSPVINSQILKILYFIDGTEENEDNIADEENYREKNGIFQINFSQSMNTSSLLVSNSSHLISANGVIIPLTESITKLNSTVQISKSSTGFEDTTIINFDNITANTGNAEFTLYPSTLEKYKSYYIKVGNNVSDLGGTKMIHDYFSSAITTGTRPVDTENSTDTPVEVPVYSLDVEPPRLKKIKFTDSDSNSELYQKVLYSSNFSQISDPETYKDVEVNLNGESIVIIFDESIDTSTVTLNSESTRPVGSIQVSCDNFQTVVEMQEKVIQTTIEENDTFVLTPKTNLSSNSTYTIKITTEIGDNARNANYLQNEFNLDVKSLDLDVAPTDPESYFIQGEVIKGTRTLRVKSTLNIPDSGFNISGLTSGKIFFGFTSGGRGKVYDYELDDQGDITYINYTPLPTGNYIIDIEPGEICGFEEDSETYRFSVEYSPITTAPEGIVINFLPNENRLIYRELTESVNFDRDNERIYGYQSQGIGRTPLPHSSTLPGFKTGTEPNLVKFYAKDTSDDYLSNQNNNVVNISPDSDFVFEFEQTMNTDSLLMNSDLNSLIKSDHNLILSYDSNFTNCIPFTPYIQKSNNDTTFTLTPRMFSDNILLSENSFIYLGIRETARTKGNTLPYTTSTTSSGGNDILSHPYSFKVATINNFKILQVFVDGTELLEYDSNQDNSITNISGFLSLQIIFNQELNPSSLTIGQNNSIELSTDSSFQSNFVSGTLTVLDLNKNRLLFIPSSELTTLTDYYLRINNNDGIENPYGVKLDKAYTYAKFTIE